MKEELIDLIIVKHDFKTFKDIRQAMIELLAKQKQEILEKLPISTTLDEGYNDCLEQVKNIIKNL